MESPRIKRECNNDRHVRRDNDFGITWCIRCGRLYNKLVGKKISEEDRERFGIKFTLRNLSE